MPEKYQVDSGYVGGAQEMYILKRGNGKGSVGPSLSIAM
jgi:hypothetical protein